MSSHPPNIHQQFFFCWRTPEQTAVMISLLLPWISLFMIWGTASAQLCPEGEAIRPFDVHNEQNPSVFDDLTTTEIQKVYDYLKARSEFNMKENDQVTLDSTYVFNIERLAAPKAEVLAHVDGTSPKPDRMAKAVIYRGDLEPPVIEEYSVGPLPTITGHTKLSIAGQDSVDYRLRHFYAIPDRPAWDQVVQREVAKVDYILKEVTGFTFNNCTDKCLIWLPGMPGSFKTNDRSMWMFLARDVEGFYLHPVGLQFRIVAGTSLNTDDWTVDHVWFRDQTYSDLGDMAENYRMDISPDPSRNYEDTRNLYSTLNHRGGPIPMSKKRGPQTYMPDGRRYSVDGHHIDWQGWSFDFNVRTLEGMQVHDLRFKGERIAYELALSEIGIIYSGSSPSPMHTAFVDSPFHFGLQSYGLIPGLDCPEYASFFDFAHYFYFSPIVREKSVCLFEHFRGGPIRHYYQNNFAGGYEYIQGMPDNVLILRSIVTVGNYEYVFDYIFHQNGVLEIVVSLTGYILSTFYTGTPADDSRGFQVLPDGLGQIHNHWIQFKADLDIMQTSNRFTTLDIEVENIQDPADASRNIYVQKFSKNLRTTEQNATCKYDFDKPKYLVFQNNDAENKYGNKRGYRLIPVHVNKQPLPSSWALENGLSFERYQVVVSIHKDSEVRGSSVYNMADMPNPVVNFLDFIKDDEPIVDEDLVAWVTLGSFHIPHTEDIPVVQTPTLALTYFLQPYNFFDEDPSLASRDNIRVTPRDDGAAHYEYAGDPPSFDCEPRNLPKTSDASSVVASEEIMFAVMAVISVLLSV